MGVRILTDDDNNQAALYCSTSDWAFGPVFHDHDDHDAFDRAAAFIRWHTAGDLRTLNDSEMQDAYGRWLAQESDQYARERLQALIRDEDEGVLLDHEVPELAALRIRFPEVLA